MRINKIKLCNFSSYLGEFEFDFTLGQDKKIVLIGGQNGTGKTSLFTAIKLALYGPLCFNYQTNSAFYLSKIKELINDDAYSNKEVSAYIEVDFEIVDERERKNYIVRREWNFNNQRITENLKIFYKDKQLDSDDIVFFNNYLFNELPPNLFDYFFFDGEEVAKFFASNNYNSYLKNAFLTLCSLDTFELIKKFTENYISSSENSEEIILLTQEYDLIKASIDQVNEQIADLEKKETSYNEKLAEIYSDKEILDKRFKESGGMSENEREELNNQLKDKERAKDEISINIKNYLEGLMPFIITKDIASNVKKQISLETEVQQYNILKNKLESDEFKNSVIESLNTNKISSIDVDNFAKDLAKKLIADWRPDNDQDTEELELIHDLSQEQNSKVSAVLEDINKFDAKKMILMINAKTSLAQETSRLNKILRDTLSEIDFNSFSKQFTELTESEYETKAKLDLIVAEEQDIKSRYDELNTNKTLVMEKIKANAKDKNIYELTQKTSFVMSQIIDKMLDTKYKQIEELSLNMLKKIMRKENLIDLVEIDNKFNINLYKIQSYQYKELSRLIQNIGLDELSKRIGGKGVEILLNHFNINSFSQLKNILKKSQDQVGIFDDISISIFKKIELNQLSKGEKQIFILCLYWAIIKASGKDLPFIIDTPYARIDTEHREQISREFFPSISDQVIIFSTDEEINKTYYKVIKPFIGQEYLLEYDETISKTIVNTGYFFRGDNL
ncbi:MAG: AAA family ATPase [Bacteroidota bacterium]